MKPPSDAAPATPVAISYSGGSSSEWLVRAVMRGVLKRPEHLLVVFADTGLEHTWTYEAVSEVEEACRREGIDFVRCAHQQSLDVHLLEGAAKPWPSRADHPPLYVAKDNGRGRIEHRCTRAFKVAPMRRAVSAWLKQHGLPKRVTKWVGFGLDEAHCAMKAVGRQDRKWERLDFPAMRMRLRRGEQRVQLERWTGRAPRFSMCTICPFKNPSRWQQTPEAQRERVYEIDEGIRDLSCMGVTEGDVYHSDRLIPVEQLIRTGDPQPNLPGLESYCDSGACFL